MRTPIDLPTADVPNTVHDRRDPSPWLALYLDHSNPLPEPVRAAWLRDTSSRSRQFLLPLVRPLARLSIILIQLLRIVLPNRLHSSALLHRLIVFGLKRFVRPEANWLILRHFHLGSQILRFVADNASPRPLQGTPLRPADLDALRDHLFLQHDLNLFNFVIELNQALAGKAIRKPEQLDFSAITPVPLRVEDMPNGWLNVIDLQTAIELYTPVYQLFLTDNDFWRSVHSLQLDEVIGIYVAKLLDTPEYLVFLNNKHPLVPMSTLRAGSRLVLHGLSTEMLHGALMQAQANSAPIPAEPSAKAS
jgi:hypothetical protein